MKPRKIWAQREDCSYIRVPLRIVFNRRLLAYCRRYTRNRPSAAELMLLVGLAKIEELERGGREREELESPDNLSMQYVQDYLMGNFRSGPCQSDDHRGKIIPFRINA